MAIEPVVLDATIGGASANSYLDLATAESYIHARPFHDAWDAITQDDEKKAALIWATRILSHYKWVGAPVSDAQALPWPRDSVYDNDGRLYANDDYPEWLKVSTAELALSLITSDRLNDTGTEGFSKIELGSLKLTVDPADRVDWIPDYIVRAISPWFKNQASKISRPVLRA